MEVVVVVLVDVVVVVGLVEVVVILEVVVVVLEVVVVLLDVDVVVLDVVVVVTGIVPVEPMSPNLMLEKVALTVAAVVFTPPVQEPALPPSSHDMPLGDGSSHKLTAKTIPLLNAWVRGVNPPSCEKPFWPVAEQKDEVIEFPPTLEAEFWITTPFWTYWRRISFRLPFESAKNCVMTVNILVVSTVSPGP